jgi:sigma-E factor negative regulatory protein RseC
VVKFEIVEEIGIIERVEGTSATITVLRRSACDGCSSVLCKPAGQAMTIEALNPIHAQVGQKVRISMKSNTYLRSALLVYGIPAIALVTGAVFGREVLGTYFIRQDPDSLTAVSGFAACVLAFFAVKIWSCMTDRGKAVNPVIEEILGSE